jgi:hypothetical protein
MASERISRKIVENKLQGDNRAEKTSCIKIGSRKAKGLILVVMTDLFQKYTTSAEVIFLQHIKQNCGNGNIFLTFSLTALINEPFELV